MSTEMEGRALDGNSGLLRQQQENLFVDIVVKNLNVPPRAIYKLL